MTLFSNDGEVNARAMQMAQEKRLPGFSAIGGRLDGKVTSVTMFAGRLFAATANGVFMLNEQGEWAALELTP